MFAYEKEKDWIAWEYVNDICCFESSCFLLAFENNQESTIPLGLLTLGRRFLREKRFINAASFISLIVKFG